MKECIKCKKTKSLNEFGNNKLKKDGKQQYCKVCQAEFDHNNYLKDPKKHKIKKDLNRKRIEEWFKNYKQTLKCKKCGDKRWYILQFHHLDPKTKEKNVSDMLRYSISKIINEINKCVPLCSNCHAEFHYLEKTKIITIDEYIG
jgi:hypothetical protein